MRKIAAILLAVFLLVLLVGCSPRITSGEVIAKEYTPARTTLRLVPVVTSNGKTTTTTMIPVYHHYPDSWKVTISGPDESGELVQETFLVEKAVYDSVSIGDEFEYEEGVEPDCEECSSEQVD